MTGARRLATRRLLLVVLIVVGALWAPTARPRAAQTPVAPAPDFRVSITPETLVVHRGQTGTVTVKVERVEGFKGRVELLSSLLYATAMSFSPASIVDGADASVLSISPSDAAIRGKYSVSITATNGAISHSITVAVNVK